MGETNKKKTVALNISQGTKVTTVAVTSIRIYCRESVLLLAKKKQKTS